MKYLAFLIAATLSGASLDPGTAARITSAREQIARNPARPDGYTSLALALVKAARATDHPDYLKQAEEAVAGALRVAPDDFEARKAGVIIRLAQARYREALDQAKLLNRRIPDDNLMYGLLADAAMALGDYAAAEKATQRMLDQRAVNAPALQRGAELREIFGYGAASLEWWNSALRLTSSSDVEERAWILAQMSGVSLRMGKPADAERQARQALGLLEDYPWANDALGAALLAQDKPKEASQVLERRFRSAPNLRTQFYLAQALEAAGRSEEASAAWKQFERDAAAATLLPVNANRELVEYYLSHGRAADARNLAAAECGRRQDIQTLAVYAAALMAEGNDQDARVQMDRALAPGVHNAALFYQAGLIAARLHDKASAVKYLRQTIEMNAASHEASRAIQLLAGLS